MKRRRNEALWAKRAREPAEKQQRRRSTLLLLLLPSSLMVIDADRIKQGQRRREGLIEKTSRFSVGVLEFSGEKDTVRSS